MSKPFSLPSVVKSAVVCGVMLCATATADAAFFDFLFGKSSSEAEDGQVDPKQRSWSLGQFTRIELVPSEHGAPANQHPAQWTADMLRQKLAAVQTSFRGAPEPLFSADELATLTGPLSQALALAKPSDDVVLLSTHRRANGIAMAPFGVTARLFVRDGSLQMIVHDTRLDFYDTYLGTRVKPAFTYGSRAKPGDAMVKSESATSVRTDWLSFAGGLPAAPAAAAAGATPASSGTVPAMVQSAGADAKPPTTAPMPVAAVPPTAAAPAARPRDAASADDIEQRLTTLKRLRDKQLISEEEYQQKRKEVLQLL